MKSLLVVLGMLALQILVAWGYLVLKEQKPSTRWARPQTAWLVCTVLVVMWVGFVWLGSIFTLSTPD